jgi:carbon storage regulator CsrA
MLVLSRREDEAIVLRIGKKDILVEVLEILPGRVRLGLTAPAEVIILRGELDNIRWGLNKGTQS